jgi:signal peptidase
VPKTVLKVLNILVNVLLSVAIVILLLIIILKVMTLANKKNYLDFFGYSIFNIATGSMEPTIHENDIILVKKQKSYKVGDIITYEKNNSYITHRIVEINKSGIIAKGDANNTTDAPIKRGVVIGRVIKIIEHGGIWQKILTTKEIYITIFITLLAFDFALSYKDKNEEKKTKSNKLIEKENCEIEEPMTLYDDFDKTMVLPKLKKKEEKIDGEIPAKEEEKDEYTIRLDLSEISKEIKENIDKED